MTDQEKDLFNAICSVYIYHSCDLDWPNKIGNKKFDSHVVTVISAGLGNWDAENKELDDLEKLTDKYNEMLEEYVSEHFPDTYKPTYDYWGAKAITDQPNGTRKCGYMFAGDTSGHYTFFEDFAALEEYTQEAIEHHNL